MSQAVDLFNRANETPVGGSWSSPGLSGAGTLNLSSNAIVVPTVGSDSFALYTGTKFSDDHAIECDLSVTGTSGGGTGGGLCLRASGTGAARTLYWMIADHASSTNIEIGKFVSGTHTTLKTVTQSWTDGSRFRFAVLGTQLVLWINGAVILAAGDASVTTGVPGLAWSSVSTAGTWDNVIVEDVARPSAPHRMPLGV